MKFQRNWDKSGFVQLANPMMDPAIIEIAKNQNIEWNDWKKKFLLTLKGKDISYISTHDGYLLINNTKLDIESKDFKKKNYLLLRFEDELVLILKISPDEYLNFMKNPDSKIYFVSNLVSNV